MNNHLAIVTGAGTGIGQGIARELGRAGYDVAVHYNSSAGGALEVVEEIQSFGRRAMAIQADLTRQEGREVLFRKALDFLGGLTLYANNSGVTKTGSFLTSKPELFDYLTSIDLKAAYFCVQLAAKAMVDRRVKGNIVVISSNNAFLQKQNVTIYGIMKAGLVKMVKHTAMELARYGIRVNCVAPGWTLTPRIIEGTDVEKVTQTIPMKRMARAEEIGRMVLFYASDACASVTGNCIIADGGVSLVSDRLESYGL